MTLDQVLTKVRGLRRLATSDNVHEAAAAAADKLIQEYRLDETVIELTSGAAEGACVDSEPLLVAKRKAKWQELLISFLCTHYEVMGFNRTRTGVTSWFMCGRPSDLRLVHEMHTWLAEEIDRLARGAVKGTSALASFRMGATVSVVERLMAQKRESLAAAASTTAALALASRLDQAKLVLAAEVAPAPATPFRPPVIADGDAFALGKVAGRTLSLAPGKLLK